MSELERKVQVLQMEATTLSAQVTMVQVCSLKMVSILIWASSFDNISYCCSICLQKDYAGLATRNKEMKIRLQGMEQQAQLRDGVFASLFFSVYVHFLNW